MATKMRVGNETKFSISDHGKERGGNEL